MKRREFELMWLLPATAFASASISSLAHATNYLSTEQARKIFFGDADTFYQQIVKLTDDQKDQIEKQSGVRQRKSEPEVWRAKKGDKFQGWMIVDDVIGKHEYITYAAALSPDGKVLGVEILTYRETHGGQIREPDWRKKFIGKTLADPFKLDVDVPNISGATLSSRNVLDGVKRLLVLQKLVLGNG